ncbi:MAG: 2-hydroxyacyl-CoA dehydratase, partial [Candidatus Tectomicrobia bacterium]|nr:2-hydroxyacyl-CoA dehydratase [Candidatus Tectomicrobia bacterium]
NAWIGETFPGEVLELFDLVPVHIEGLVMFLTFEGLGKEIFEAGQKYTLSRDLCIFQTGCIQAIYEGNFPDPQVFLRTNVLCDGREKVLQLASHVYQKPYLYIDMPNHYTPGTVDYVARQWEGLFRELSEMFGVQPTDSRIEEVFALSNRIRENLIEINQLRKKGSPYPVQSIGMVEPIFANGYLRADGELVRLSEKIVAEMRAHAASASPSSDKIRLLWTIPFLFPAEEFYHWLLEEKKVEIVMEEAAHIYWEPLDPQDPFRSLARKVLGLHWQGPVQRRAQVMLQDAREYQADGVLHFSHWGCRHLIAPSKILQDYFSKEEIPFLDLDVDLGDGSNINWPNLKGQIEAFLEILRRKKGA